MRELFILMKADFVNLFSNKVWLFYMLIFPILLILALGWMMKGSYEGSLSSYDYYGVTMMIYAALNASSLAANCLLEKKVKRANLRVLLSPIKEPIIIISKSIATAVFSMICLLIAAIVVSVTMDVNFGGSRSVLLAFLLLNTIFFSTNLSLCICVILKSEEITSQIVSNILLLFSAIGGLFFSLEQFGPFWTIISYISPVKWAVSSVFSVIYDDQYGLYILTNIGLISTSCLLLVCSSKKFKGADYV